MNLNTCKMLPWYTCSLHCFSTRLPQSRTEDSGHGQRYRHPRGYDLPLTLLKLLEGLSLAHTAGHLLLILLLIEPRKTLGSECPGTWGSGRGSGAWEEGKGRGSTLAGACPPALRMVRVSFSWTGCPGGDTQCAGTPAQDSCSSFPSPGKPHLLLQ